MSLRLYLNDTFFFIYHTDHFPLRFKEKLLLYSYVISKNYEEILES